MLKSIRQKKENRIQEKMETHLNAGIEQLRKKMYNAALVEFGKAMKLDLESVYPILLKELESAAANGEMDAALAVGLNLLKYKKDDFELANKLGNYARKNKGYNQAKALYKTALKINKNFKLAFYNLAATDTKVELYDESVIDAISRFKDIKGYILPGYTNNANPIEQLTENAIKRKRLVVKERIQDLTSRRDKEMETGNSRQAHYYESEIEKLKKTAEKVTADDICPEFKRLISADPENSESHCFNLSVYALENNKPNIAEEALRELDDKKIPTKGLLQAIVLDQKGQRDEAIDTLMAYLGKNEFNRYYNANLGLIYRKSKNQFLAVKYLIKTAELLNKSDGIYDMRELLKEADQSFKQGDLKKALKFYRIVISEIKDPNIWLKMGMIHKEGKLNDEAVVSFKEALQIDPNLEEGLNQLQQIHDYYVSNGDSLILEKKYHPAVEQFEKALGVIRTLETLEKTAQGYRLLSNIKMSNQLLEECENIVNSEKVRGEERLRQALTIKAKMLMKKQQYQKAIEVLESVFDLKIDKNIYAQLTTLYKKFKGKDSLLGLEKRWNDMLIKKEREEIEAKQKEREDQEKENKKNSSTNESNG